MHIRPDSTELVRLLPNPNPEAELGEFPVAFTLPEPQQPPRPFSNHEAPAAFGNGGGVSRGSETSCVPRSSGACEACEERETFGAFTSLTKGAGAFSRIGKP
jgi:hypothetical protein